jgi:molybdenum cofactor guanylyltransferase
MTPLALTSPMPTPQTTCTGVILAGGASSRFGGLPKGLESVQGVRVIDRVAAALAPAADTMLLVANDDAADEWLPAVRRIRDRVVGRGPLAGIQAALIESGTAVLVVAWDMPFLSTSLLRALRERGDRGARAVLPTGPEGRLEPLCAWYSHDVLSALESLIARDERRVGALAESVGATTLDTAEVARHGDAERMFANVNTAEDLRRLRE